MDARIVDYEGKKYIEGMPGNMVLRNESDAIDLLSLGSADRINRILPHVENLTPDFFDLKTGVAGAIPSNYGGDFRVFQDKAKAVQWLLRDC